MSKLNNIVLLLLLLSFILTATNINAAITNDDIYSTLGFDQEVLFANNNNNNNNDDDDIAIDWTDVSTMDVSNRAPFPSNLKRKSFFDRLPAEAENTVRSPVWTLSTMSAGFYVDFQTESSFLQLNITYRYETMSMWHFPATGCSGMDLYNFDYNTSTWRWTSTTTIMKYPQSINHMITVPAQTTHPTEIPLYRLHLPTYNGIKYLAIGHDTRYPLIQPKQKKLIENHNNNKKPIVWYGTSILQGAVASRPGMIFTNWISRNIQREIYNFGFSGNGIMEINVANYLTTIDASVFIIDCLPNMNATLVTNRTIPLVDYIREKHPTTPIILVAGTWYGDHWFDPTPNDSKRQALVEKYNELIAKTGDKDLYLIENSKDELFNEEVLINPTVGGTHPSDLGHMEITKFYTKYLNDLLKKYE